MTISQVSQFTLGYLHQPVLEQILWKYVAQVFYTSQILLLTCQKCRSTQGNTKIPATGLASSFIDPLSDSWKKGCCSFYYCCCCCCCCYYYYCYYYYCFMAPWTVSGTIRVSQYQKGKTRKVKPIWIYWSKRVSGSGSSWAICKSALRPRQITTPASHHSIYYRTDALPPAKPTASKHWRQKQTESVTGTPSHITVVTITQALSTGLGLC